VTTSDSNDQIIVNFFLQKQSSVVILLVSFDELFKFSHSRLKRKQEWQLLEEQLYLSGAFAK